MQEPAGTIELVCMGNRDLIGADGGRATGLLAQPKRFALFAYLVQSRRGRPISRDELVPSSGPTPPSRRRATRSAKLSR